MLPKKDYVDWNLLQEEEGRSMDEITGDMS